MAVQHATVYDQVLQLRTLQLAEMLIHLAEVPAVVFVTAYDEYAIRAFECTRWTTCSSRWPPARLAATLARVSGRGDHGRELLERM